MKKVIAYILSFTILFSTVFISYSTSVNALEVAEAVEVVEYGYNFIQGLLSQTGIIADDVLSEKIRQYISDSNLTAQKNDDGTVTISEDTMKQFKELLDSYFKQEDNLPDLVWMPVIHTSDFSSSFFYDLTQYYQFKSISESTDLVFVHRLRNAFQIADCSDYYLSNNSYDNSSWKTILNGVTLLTTSWGSTSSFGINIGGLISRDGVITYLKSLDIKEYSDSGLQDSLSTSKMADTLTVLNPWCTTYYGVYDFCTYTWIVASDDCGFNYIPVFKHADAYKEYVTGQADYYKLDPIYQGGDVVIDPDIDYGQIYDAVKQGMLDSVENGEKISNQLSHMQDVYNQTMQKLLNISEDIADNTAETNSLLEQIYKRLNEGFLESGDHFTTLEDIDRDILSHLSNALNDLSTVLKEQNTLLKNNFSDITDKMGDLLDADNKLYEEITQGFADIAQGFSDMLDSLEEMKEIMSNFSFTVVDSGGGSGDSGGDSGKKSFWSRLGELASLLFTTFLDLVSMILFKFLDALLYLVNILVDNASVAFDTVGTSLTNVTERMSFGSEFFSEIYAHLPPEVNDLITLAISCLVIGGLISYVKSG